MDEVGSDQFRSEGWKDISEQHDAFGDIGPD